MTQVNAFVPAKTYECNAQFIRFAENLSPRALHMERAGDAKQRRHERLVVAKLVSLFSSYHNLPNI